MRKFKRKLYVFSFLFDGEKCFHDVKMLPKYSREQALSQFKKANPNAIEVKIESVANVIIEM